MRPHLLTFRPPTSACRSALVVGLGLAPCACGSTEQEGDFPADAPVVIATTPRDGESAVDAGLSEITATFSEAMDPQGWSWATELGREIPAINGLPFYRDESTTVLPVQLEPGTSYVIWVNSPDDADLQNFTNLAGVAARAHRIRFTTRAGE